MITAPAARVGRRVGEVGGRHPDESGIGPVHVGRTCAPHGDAPLVTRSSGSGAQAAVTNSCWASAGPSAMERGPRSRMSVPSGARDATVASVPGTKPCADR